LPTLSQSNPNRQKRAALAAVASAAAATVKKWSNFGINTVYVVALPEIEDTRTMFLNFSFSGWLLCVLGLLISAVVGAIACGWWLRRQARQRMIAPSRWPVDSRNIVNTQERKTWGWLNHVFFDHAVIVKMPVTRFTMPETKSRDFYW
jgi:hypothetical protein